jgi:hypothetical protein
MATVTGGQGFLIGAFGTFSAFGVIKQADFETHMTPSDHKTQRRKDWVSLDGRVAIYSVESTVSNDTTTMSPVNEMAELVLTVLSDSLEIDPILEQMSEKSSPGRPTGNVILTFTDVSHVSDCCHQRFDVTEAQAKYLLDLCSDIKAKKVGTPEAPAIPECQFNDWLIYRQARHGRLPL